MLGRRQLGSLIGAIFGLVYLLVNASALPPSTVTPVRVLAAIAFVFVLGAIGRRRGRSERTARAGFGPGYWLVVAGEVIALVAGLVVINRAFHAPQASVAWVSLVVGVHFLAFAAVFRERLFSWLGAAIGVCGLVGLGLAAAGAGRSLMAILSGIVPGVLLLASAWWGVGSARTRSSGYDTNSEPT
jgi:hypothetical protein